jgi:hypothetical protein
MTTSTTDIAGKEWLQHVAALQESDLRGHAVALTYHEYSHLLDEFIWGDWNVKARLEKRLPLRHTNANWFNFGVWATVTINRDIRHKTPPFRAQRVLPMSLRTRLTPALMGLTAGDGQRISRALSWGQRLVFLSTTYAFLELRDSARPRDEDFVISQDGAFDCDWPAEILNLSGWDGRDSLDRHRHLKDIARAFDHYRKAHLLVAAERAAQEAAGRSDHAAPPHSKAIAREIMLGNLLITAVEQDVVDAAVRQVIDHVPSLASVAVTAKASQWAESFLGVPRQIAALQVPQWLLPTRLHATELWARLMTDQILVINLPAETLRLGRDIPARRPSQTFFPEELTDLADLNELGELGELGSVVEEDCLELARRVGVFDRSRGSGRGSGAWDWRRYDDRMNWAVTLLRSRQQDPTLFWAPYSDEDRRSILEGRRPRSDGDPANYEVLAPVDGSAVWPE